MQISPSTRPIGLIGNPVSHSLSPKLHNNIYEKYGLDYVYLAFDTEKDKLSEVVKAFKALSFVGFNVTVPHKQRILEYLDEIDTEAKVIGAVNTVKIEGDRLIGYNTDGSGFIDSLKNKGYEVQGKNILVLGAGGSARAICAYLAKEKASSISIWNRTESNALDLAEHIKNYYPRCFSCSIHKIDIFSNICDIIINTTSVGMWPNASQSPIEGFPFVSEQLVVDIIYNPLETMFLKEAKGAGCETMNGMDMLIGQAIKAIKIWTDVSVTYH